MNLYKIHSYIPLISAVLSGLALLIFGFLEFYKAPAAISASRKNNFSVEYIQILPDIERIYILTDGETEQQYIVIQNEKGVSITPRLNKEAIKND